MGRILAFITIFVLSGAVQVKAPVIPDSDRAKVIKFKLDDARYSNAIQSRWLAIYQTPEYQQILQLQKQQQANAAAYQNFVSGLCKVDGWSFDPASEDIQCMEKPKEKK